MTFAYNKTGLWLYPGADAAGQIHIADIGITKESFLEKEPQMLMPQAEDLTRLPKRKADSNKGTYGKVLVIACLLYTSKRIRICDAGPYTILRKEF